MENKQVIKILRGIFIVLIIQCITLVVIFVRIDSGGLNPMRGESNGVPAVPDIPKTTIFFDSIFHDFGTINDDKKVLTNFRFKNTGESPLVIVSAEGSCGCTVPEYPKEAILPGKTAEIKVSFDPAGKLGEQTKMITITANTEPATTILTVRAQVAKH